MSDRAALKERLRRLAAAGLGGGAERELRGAEHDDLVREILIEADTVVMPRELRIEGGTGRGLVLEIANRRVLRASVPGGEAAPAILDPSDEETAGTLRGMVDAAVGSGQAVRLRHGPLRREIDPAEPGISVRAVAEGWGIALETGGGKSPAEVLDGFLSGASGLLTAWVMVSEESSESFGDDDLVEGLVALGESDLSERLRNRSGRDAWRFAAMGPFLEEAPHRAIGAVGRTLFLMAIAPGALGEVIDHWRRALG